MLLIQLLLLFIHPENNNSLVSVTVPHVVAHRGQQASIKVEVTVKDGFHIQANPVNNEAFIPTTVKIENYENLEIGTPLYPKAKKFKLEGTDEFLDVYDGSFEIIIPLKTKQIKEGDHVLRGELHFQACDHKICFFPKTTEFTIQLKIK